MNMFKKCLILTLIMLIPLLPGGAFSKTESSTAARKCIISGKISLPKGMKAPNDITVKVYFYEKNGYADTHSSKSYAASATALIEAGSNSGEYFLGVDPNTEGYIGYTYNQADDSTFWHEGFYASNGTTFNSSKAKLMKTQKTYYTNTNLQLIKGRKLSGKVSIPHNYDNAALSYYCSVVPVYDNGTPNNLKDDVDIPQAFTNHATFLLDNQNMNKQNKVAEYSMIVPNNKASYRIKYVMQYDFPSYGGYPFINEGYYAKTGTTADYNKAAVININGSYRGSINFTILEAGTIQGKIYIEDGKKAVYDIIVELETDENRTYGHGRGVVIEKGENSAEYRLYFQDLKHKHIVTVVDNLKPIYYFGNNKLVKDKASARQFDLSKGNIKGFDVVLPDEIAESIRISE
jgi:hypothetical protein